MKWYYRYEVKAIQEWIFSSNRLRDLAGGSYLIKQVERRAQDWAGQVGGEVHYAAAGGMTATFPSLESLQQFASEWPMWVAHAAPGLLVTQAWLPFDGRSEGEAVEELHLRLAAARNCPPAPWTEAGPLIARAGRSGLPALRLAQAGRTAGHGHIDKAKGAPGTWDARAAAKAVARSEMYQDREETRGGGETLSGVLKELSKHSPECANLDHFQKWVQSEAVLSEDSSNWPSGPVALIHADGSGVGRVIHEVCGRPEPVAAMKSLSRALSDATACATAKAIIALADSVEAQLQGSRKELRELPVRPIVIGGDDMTVLVPARYGLKFVAQWSDGFKSRTKELRDRLAGSGLYSGAGVVFVGKNYPFAEAYRMAEALCSSAKSGAVGENGLPSRSVARFYRSTASLLGSDYLIAGPHTWDTDVLETGLKTLMRESLSLPKGALRRWLSLLETAPNKAQTTRANSLWKRMKEVGEKRGRWKEFAAAMEGVKADPDTGLFRWATLVDEDSRDKLPENPIFDLVTLMQVSGGEVLR